MSTAGPPPQPEELGADPVEDTFVFEVGPDERPAGTTTVRSEAELPDDAVVVRGGQMRLWDLERSVDRCEAELGVPGVSVFAAAGLDERQVVEAAPPLHRFSWVSATRAGDLRLLGCDLVPMRQAPHFTLTVPANDRATLKDVIAPFHFSVSPLPPTAPGNDDDEQLHLRPDVWVDWNDVDDRGHVLTLRKFFVPSRHVHSGACFVASDDQGHADRVMLMGEDDNGVVVLATRYDPELCS